jgi:dTDP-4-dehydrorhamnose reductase
LGIPVRILITGVTGQVGGALTKRLHHCGTVVAASRSILDLTQSDAMPEKLDRIAPDLIINAAAYTAVDRAENESHLAMAVNGHAPGVMADWAARRRVPLIHFSTDYVFSGEGSRPWREDDGTGPLSVYGLSKLTGEDNIRKAGGVFLIVRTSWVYGATGTNFLRTIARLATEREELRVVNDQMGAPTSAAIIADATKRMIEGGIDNLCGQIHQAKGFVHLAAAGETSWYGFAEAIITGLNRRGAKLAVNRLIPIPTSEYPSEARRPYNSRLNLNSLRRIFGIGTPNWESGLTAELDVLISEFQAQNK